MLVYLSDLKDWGLKIHEHPIKYIETIQGPGPLTDENHEVTGNRTSIEEHMYDLTAVASGLKSWTKPRKAGTAWDSS